MDRNQIILTCVLAYMAMCIVIGVWAMRRTRNTHDFFMAGRNLGVWLTGVAMFSSMMSGFGFVGGPGLVYKTGTSSFWILLTSPIGFCITYYLLGKRLRMLGQLREAVSLPDVVEARYNSRAARFWVAAAILAGVVGYLATQILAMTRVLQQIFASNGLPGGEVFCVGVSCAVLVFYCVTGGIIASVYTDMFQGIMMLVAALLIFLTAMTTFDGGSAFDDGFTGMSQTIQADGAEAAGPWGALGMVGCLSTYFLFALGIIGQPHLVTKIMMSRRVEDARFTLPITIGGYGVAALLWVGIGMLMRAMVLSGKHPELTAPDTAAAEFLQNYTQPVLAGLVYAGLFAAIMSTADGFLNIGAAAVVHDIPRAIRGRSLTRELLWARVATVLLAIGAAAFALASPFEMVGKLGIFGWGTFASALVPAVGFGLNWKRATAKAACISIVASLVINLIVLAMLVGGVGLPYGIAGGALALLTSTTLFVGISLMSKPPKIDEDVEAIMDL